MFDRFLLKLMLFFWKIDDYVHPFCPVFCWLGDMIEDTGRMDQFIDGGIFERDADLQRDEAPLPELQ